MPQDLDLSYLALEVGDADPQRIVDDAVEYAQTILPDWVPRNGATEVVIMEALALGVADLIYAANRLPGTVVEAILALYDIPRSLGASATGAALITFDTTRTVTVAAGTRFEVPGQDLILAVTAATTGTSVGTLVVPVATEEPTGGVNGLAVGTSLDIIDSIPYAVAAEISTALTGGSDAESDAAFLDRAGARLARVTSSLVIPVHFSAYCLEDIRVSRAEAIDLYDVTDVNAPGEDVGHISIYLYGRGGALAAEVLAELEAAMQAASSAMLAVHVASAAVLAQDVSLAVVALPGYSTLTVQANVEAKLRQWMNPETWTWGDDIIVNDLIAQVGAVEGVDYVDSVTTPSGTITVDFDTLVTADTVTVSVS
jgi:uncharacterized phage protein gp47/JayE